MTDRANRRLAAILAADVAGYTRLVQQDEEGTIRSFQACRRDLIDPCIHQFGGRIANTAGDSLLVEFRSAVDAARCALDIQTALAERNANTEDAPKIELRIGLNVGDVIGDGEDLLGDGVNIAARLEQMAEPGAVTASAAFADQVRGRAPLDLKPLGAKRLKNVADPVEVFAVLPVGSDDAPRVARPSRLVRPIVVVIALAVLAVLTGLAWLKPWQTRMAAADAAHMAFPLPDKPSVAVLPFSDLSEDPGYLADGLTDDLITDLGSFAGLFVIAGNTSFAYRTADMDIARFAEALGVRYVVDGSVRRSGDTLRINARLVDAVTGQISWADRFDGRVEDVFQIQSRLVEAIVGEMEVPVSEAEMASATTTDTQLVEAREAFQRGWELYGRFDEDDNIAAIAFFERAVELDPDYGRAYAALALAHLRPHLFYHWNNYQADGKGLHIESFYKNLKEASRHETSLVHVLQAMLRLNLRDIALPVDARTGPQEARLEAARAIALNPNDPEAHMAMAWSLIVGGQPAEGLTFVDAAKRLNPAYPNYYVLFQAAGLYASGDIEGAIASLSDGLKRDPMAVEFMPVQASFLAQTGQRREARNLLDRWLPGENPASLAANVDDFFFIVRWSGPQEYLNRQLKDGLRLAALPENVTVASLRFDLASGDPVRQHFAALNLGLFGTGAVEAVPDLVEVLSADSAILRKAAITTLGKIGPEANAAIPALQRLADTSLIGGHARRALALIGGN